MDKLAQETGPCACCGGGGKVLSILNEIRPCSRCRIPEFDAWAKNRPHRDVSIDYRPLGEEAK